MERKKRKEQKKRRKQRRKKGGRTKRKAKTRKRRRRRRKMGSRNKGVRQESDKNLTKLREIGARPENKTCFDCGQKGPTYVNTTIGSFVCTHCSGLL